MKGSGSGLGMKFNKKSLPPLPSGGLRRLSSQMNLTLNSRSTASPTSIDFDFTFKHRTRLLGWTRISSQVCFPLECEHFHLRRLLSGTSHALAGAADGFSASTFAASTTGGVSRQTLAVCRWNWVLYLGVGIGL